MDALKPPRRERFSHRLARSAIRQRASEAERQAVHAAFVEVFAGQPERQAWHRAAAAVVPTTPSRRRWMRRRRSRGVAVSCCALRAGERAAQLSEDPAGRCRRTLDAAELARELGLSELLGHLLRQAAALDPAPRDSARLTWLRGVVPATDVPGAAAAMIAGANGEIALKLLATEAENGFWADRGGVRLREALLAQALVVAPGADEARVLSIRAFSDPIGQGATVLEALSRFDSGAVHDPELSARLGGAAAAVGDPELAERFCGVAIAALREQGRVVPLVRALVVSASAQIQLGRWVRAHAEAREAAQLARETDQPVQEAAAEAARALVAALRGDVDAMEAHASSAERLALTTGARGVLGEAQLARGLEALGAGRPADAFEHLWRMFEPSDPAYHRFLSAAPSATSPRPPPTAIAASRSRSCSRAWSRSRPGRLRRSCRPDLPGPRAAGRRRRRGAPFRAALGFGHAALAVRLGTAATRLWRLAAPATAGRRFALAAAHGARRVRSARRRRWSARARGELRATGETCRRLTDETRDELTPQELQIAQLATEGLSNREIGARLYLSHRTIGSHLYRIFPKLGITSRAELRVALASEDLYAAA